MTSHNFSMSYHEFDGQPRMNISCDAWADTPIGSFGMAGDWLAHDERTPDFEDLTDTSDEADDLRDEWQDRAVSALWIRAAAENDPEALIDGIKTLYNCREAEVSDDYRIWIADPQAGHWLDDGGMARIGRALKAGDI